MSSQPQYPLPAAVIASTLGETEQDRDDRETVGASDAHADAQRAGADADLSDAYRDSDGVPVDRAALEADMRRAAAKPETD